MAAGHDHPLLESICDRALLLDGGRITAEGPFAEVRRAYIGPSDG
jgi:ABC-type polysaccharide/polyol phosphate transport system ATPase subunit